MGDHTSKKPEGEAVKDDWFEPYRKEDVKVGGKDGFVKVHAKGLGMVWATVVKPDESEIKASGGRYVVVLLGSGKSPVFQLEDFSPEEQRKLLTTA